MLAIVSVDLHRCYDKKTNSKPTGWFWLPDFTEADIIEKMLKYYVGQALHVDSRAGETTNARRDPESVCTSMLC